MSYAAAKNMRAVLDASVARLSVALGTFPRGARGLPVESVRLSTKYRAAKGAYDAALRTLQAFNRQFVRRFKNEIRAERHQRSIEES
ncbi:MAG: hypothetical protein HXX10_07505 [Rhodoplanes sp.]|uniref:hypothetical protein n=1 Tax=Rhodoplanes sp. TaxID=1968906 RepID=UPI0018085743|nr:hypothetical protein [Rhodoplanes sp.]NVO13866.1 hypothetical protein [Rhodoplanes sp.]